MANHVYFNIEIDGLTEEQHECLFKSEVTSRPHWIEGEDPIEYKELIDLHEQPFMSKVERTYDKDGWIEDSYNWYCFNIGAKWCHIEEWDYGMITGHSAWSHPVAMVENMLEWASNQFNIELSAKMTYEDEFRNFIGTCHFYFDEEVHYDICEAENSDLIDELREVFGDAVDESGFDWYDLQKDLKGVEREPQEVFDDIVYAWFERN